MNEYLAFFSNQIFSGLEFVVVNWLETAISILAVVNGLILFRNYVRDKPLLIVSPVHPEVYQWWFRLPDVEGPKGTIRGVGFLAYIAIANKGMRAVAPIEIRLIFRSKNLRKVVLPMNSIPEPRLESEDGKFSKRFPVLLQGTGNFKYSGPIQPGDSTSGMSLFVYQCYGHEVWDPKIKNNKITTAIRVKDVFGRSVKCKFMFKKKTLESIRKMLPDFEIPLDEDLKDMKLKFDD